MKKEIRTEELLTAIRKHCLQCSGGSVRCVEICTLKKCELYPYRSRTAIGCRASEGKVKGQISVEELMNKMAIGQLREKGVIE